MNINLHIERLVVDDSLLNEPGQGRYLQASISEELSRLLRSGGVSPSLSQGAVLLKIAAPALRQDGNNKQAPLGQQIARSVYGGIGHE